MKVRAIKRGVYKHMREVGDEFEIEDSLFSERWMSEIEQPKSSRKTRSNTEKGEAEAKSERE